MKKGRIAAMGGGGFSMEPRNLRLDTWLLALTGQKRPRVLFVPTASGDSVRYIARFQRAFAKHACVPSHLELFRRKPVDLEDIILSQHLVYVGGGNTANMLAVWRLHGVDRILREAWSRGILLCGPSAGAICWFDSGVTDSFGCGLQPLEGGLGLVSGSFCPHYDGEAERRPTYRKLVTARQLAPGHAADDGVALLFEGTRLVEAVSSRPGGRAFRMERGPDGAREVPLPVRLLPRP